MTEYDNAERERLLGKPGLLRSVLDDIGRENGLDPKGQMLPCPHEHHGPQTNDSPPVSVFQPRNGGPEQWKCFNGNCPSQDLRYRTVIDALVVSGRARTVGEAFRQLRGYAQRASAQVSQPSPGQARRPRKQTLSDAELATRRREGPGQLAAYVEKCAEQLWTTSQGQAALWWLTKKRGLDPETIRRNKIGIDLGFHDQWRFDGLPNPATAAITMPLLDENGTPIWVQARKLRQDSNLKYLGPDDTILGLNPRVGHIASQGDADPDLVIVVEGMLESYLVGQQGYTAIPILGSGLADEETARRLVQIADGRLIVLALDGDEAGRGGSARLAALLEAQPGAAVVEACPPTKDFTVLRRDDPELFAERFRSIISEAAAQARGQSGAEQLVFTAGTQDERRQWWEKALAEAETNLAASEAEVTAIERALKVLERPPETKFTMAFGNRVTDRPPDAAERIGRHIRQLTQATGQREGPLGVIGSVRGLDIVGFLGPPEAGGQQLYLRVSGIPRTRVQGLIGPDCVPSPVLVGQLSWNVAHNLDIYETDARAKRDADQVAVDRSRRALERPRPTEMSVQLPEQRGPGRTFEAGQSETPASATIEM